MDLYPALAKFIHRFDRDSEFSKSRLLGIGDTSSKIDRIKIGPMNRAGAHGAGLAGTVHHTARKVDRSKGFACPPESLDLAVGGRIRGGPGMVVRRRDDLAVADDHRAKRRLPRCDAGFGLLDGQLHELGVGVFGFVHGRGYAMAGDDGRMGKIDDIPPNWGRVKYGK